MRNLALGLTLASLTLVSACGGDDDSPTIAAPTATATSTTPASGGDAKVLTGTVGTKDNPDAFEITLTDSSGAAVTTLPAGKYQIKVSDLSKIHNFHLEGGSVDEKTSISDVTEDTFDVDLTAGDYTFKCDPHAQMSGDFKVT